MVFIHKSLLLIIASILTIIGAYAVTPNCEVIKYITICEISNDKLLTTDSIVLQINNRSGEDYTHIQLNYNKDNPIFNLSAWIEDLNGNVIRFLKKQDITDANAFSDFSFYEDNYVKSFTLIHNKYPYRICYTYKKLYRHFLTIAYWYPMVGLDVPTRHAQLVLINPESYRVNIFENHMGQPTSEASSVVTRRTWTTSYDGSISQETFCPDVMSFLPHVRIVPVNFVYGVPGSLDTWQSFGNWQYRLIQGLGELPDNEKKHVTELTRNIMDKKEIVRVLYHYLQDHTRYINVSIDIGGLKPYPASYVSINKFGDCKALTNYMKALLKYVGINSYYTKVNAGDQPLQILRNFPSQQFNHIILTVPLENDTIWLENTVNTNPFGYVGTFIQNRDALLIDDNQSRIIKLPALQQQDVHDGKRYDFIIRDSTDIYVSLRYTCRGYAFEILNALQTQYNLDIQHQIIHKTIPFPDFELISWKLIKSNRDARVISMVSNLTIKNILNTTGEEYYFSIVPKNRQLPVNLPFPICSSDTMVYQLPTGISEVSLPKRTSILNKYGKYQIFFIKEGNIITILREFCLNAGNYEMDEYVRFYDFISAIKADEKRKILFQ
jgi:hypothetical protein